MKNNLRNGFTTGSAASAAAVAAFRRCGDPVELLLPSGGFLTVPVHRLLPDGAVVVKDGGDDPDVTTGSEIQVRLTPFAGAPEPADYQEKTDGLELVIRGGSGVGLATRPGLAVPVGKYAVNPTPRRMMLSNLHRAGCRGKYLLEITVPDGESTAKKTLNPTLGIQGGISILGNSGIVRPYSNAAYAATVALQLKSCAANGFPAAALTTGNRSSEAVRRDFPELPSEAVVRIGDFIYTAVTAARQAAIPTLIVACMPGKLFKYACAEKNTHAHQCRLTLAKLAGFGIELPGVPLERMDSMGELAAEIGADAFSEVLKKVYPIAREVLRSWAGNTKIVLALYHESGRRLL